MGSKSMETFYKRNAKVFKAFCDERRLRILRLLQGGEKCAYLLVEEMNMPQSSLSYHMKVLCESGVVEGRQEGVWTHYRISEKGSLWAMALLEEITTTKPAQGNDVACCGV